MTIYAFEAQETWLPTVLGLPCNAVEVHDDTLRIHFGTTRTAPDNVIEAERTISLHGVWRVEHGDDIVAGSGDQRSSETQTLLSFLHGESLERFEVSQPGYDLDLFFTGRVTVRCFPCDSAQFAEDMAEDEDFLISWWIDGDGVSDDWEEPYDPAGI